MQTGFYHGLPTLSVQIPSVAARLDRLPPTPAHRTATIIAGIGSCFDLVTTALALVPTVLAAKGYSIVTSLEFTSLTFIGYPVGSALSLPIIERIDRRWLIIGSAFLMSVFGLWGPGAMFGVIAAALWIVTAVIALFAPSTTGQSLEQVSG